jgi:hypothetical protein
MVSLVKEENTLWEKISRASPIFSTSEVVGYTAQGLLLHSTGTAVS